eukprot:6388135-Lingulodinium_polyedra.AAC.1
MWRPRYSQLQPAGRASIHGWLESHCRLFWKGDPKLQSHHRLSRKGGLGPMRPASMACGSSR